ncbi:MAG TPA: phosphoribosyltransferase family protein [Clostridia bacterium]|nr:phosphoribosyltransferase family protein [Clostridia bacterium]
MFEYKKAVERFLCIFFPSRCVFCTKVQPPLRLECSDCKIKVKTIEEPICTYCGCEKEDCCCKKSRKFYNGIVSPYYYEDKVRHAMSDFKFGENTVAARLLGEKMADKAKEIYSKIDFDIITFVPMTDKKQRKRGYNQSELLAKEISEHLNIAVENNVLIKIYENDLQHGLNAYLRSGNIIGVYDVTDRDLVKDKTILLCDDIKTTGETLNECAKMLIINGAAQVWCLVGALTGKRKKQTSPKEG